jgi:TfoX/Sxy family transcriptional regulator of competence genes
MASNAAFVEKVLDQMLPLEVTARGMFGGYGLYFKGKNFALIGDDTLYIKVTDAGSSVAGRIAKEPPYPGAKPAFRISAAKRSENKWLVALIEATAASLPPPKPKKKK